MKNKVTIVVALLILSAGAYYIVNQYKKNSSVVFSKDSAIKYIVEEGKASNVSGLINLEPDYLKAWATALYYKKASFSYKGNNYNTSGGKKLK